MGEADEVLPVRLLELPLPIGMEGDAAAIGREGGSPIFGTVASHTLGGSGAINGLM